MSVQRQRSSRVRAPRRGARRRDTERPSRTLIKALAVIGVLGSLIWLAVTAYNGVPFAPYTIVYADVPAAGNLLQHDPVRIAGVRVGQVLSKAITAGGLVRLKLQLPPAIKLAPNTTVAIRASGLLGARYVQLVPGRGAGLLAPGSTLTGSANSLTYGVPEALDTFNAQTRGALGMVIRAGGLGLLGRGDQLNEAIRATSSQITPFQALITGILARPGAAGRLIPSLDEATTALSGARVAIAALPAPTASALEPFVDLRPAVQATLDRAPGTLAAAQTGLAQSEYLLAGARALAVAATGTLPAAPSGLKAATALLGDSRVPLERARPLLASAESAVPAALRITGSLAPVLEPLGHALGNLIPMVSDVGRYGCDVINLGAVFRSMTGFGGVGEGPDGPPGEFRLQIIPPAPSTAVGGTATLGLANRDGYPAPCKYLAKTYAGLSTDLPKPSAQTQADGGSG